MSKTYLIAELTDPITGKATTLTAETAEELEQLITTELEATYPAPSEGSTDRSSSTPGHHLLSGMNPPTAIDLERVTP